MGDSLYDDKLAGEITQDKYTQKHHQLLTQKDELERRISEVDISADQKRLIITSLCKYLIYDEDLVSAAYTNFIKAIADSAHETCNLIRVENE